MTQMNSSLAVATVVIDLRTLFLQPETGAHKLPMQELELKVQGEGEAQL